MQGDTFVGQQLCFRADFSTEEVQALIELAGRLDASPEPEALKGKVLSLLFLSPSLRTLASFQAAMTRLGGSDRYRTHLSVDKPLYRGGETVYVRGVVLHYANRKPTSRSWPSSGLSE